MASTTELSEAFLTNLNIIAGTRFNEGKVLCTFNGKKQCFKLASCKVTDNLCFLNNDQKAAIFDLCAGLKLDLLEFLEDKYYECDWWNDGHGNYYYVPCRITGKWNIYYGLMDEDGRIHT